LKGYRGFVREFARTGSLRALWLQVRTGVQHVVRGVRRRDARDPIELFFQYYAADGFRMPDETAAALQQDAEACLVCGLCSVACARAGGEPVIDPRDAVVAASRLAIDWVRLDLSPGSATAGGCAGCRACDAACPAGIPIHRIQDWLARETA
jgi:succinate dehydrogenase/fumarate reductase-like Fe-S protein